MRYLEFDGKKTTDIGLRVLGYSRGSFAELRDTYTDVDGRIGAMHQSQPVGMYTFTVTFRTTFKTTEERENKLEQISEFFYTEGFVRIRQSERLDRYRRGKVASTFDYTPSFQVLEVGVEFITEPFALSTEVTEVYEQFETESNEHILNLTEVGTAFSEYEIFIKYKNTVTNPSITQGGVTLKVDTTLSENDVLRVNTDTFEVDKLRMNGSEITSITSLVLDTIGEFPRIDKNSKELKLKTDSEFTCDVSLEYVKRYLF